MRPYIQSSNQYVQTSYVYRPLSYAVAMRRLLQSERDTDHSQPSSAVVHYFSVAQQPNSGPGRLTVDVSRSHTIRHIHSLGLLRPSDQLVAEAATYTTHNKHKRRKSVPSAGFEPAIPAIERLQTDDVDRTATGIGRWSHYLPHLCCLLSSRNFLSVR